MSSLREVFYTVPKISDKWDRYFDVYEKHLNKFKGKDITFIEVGVQNGGSIDMWSKYFGPNSKIYGIDIDPNCANLKYDNPNINIIIGDQSSASFWDNILPEIGNVDIFVDDGGHYMNQQITTFEKVFPKINPGGVFICEDCHTSYWASSSGGYKNPYSFIEYSKDYIDIVNYEWLESGKDTIRMKYRVANDISGVSFYDSMVVFEKEPLVEMKRVFSR
jgi:23S rRNA U2552 (ribose-2'-O)-methylase RlmE/FtsJ